jgi:hypothetical protein
MSAKARGTVVSIFKDSFRIKIDHAGTIVGKVRNVLKGDVELDRRVMFTITAYLNGAMYADEIEILPLSKRAQKRANLEPISNTTKSIEQANPEEPVVSAAKLLSGC